MTTSIGDNKVKNQAHYDRKYSTVSIDGIKAIIASFDAYLEGITTIDTTWVAMFRKDFKNQLKGKRVLELGCGDCILAVVMNKLEATVYANDISNKSGEIIAKLNESLLKDNPITFVQGDFLEAPLADNSFDMVVGKAFLHHLTLEEEAAFMKKIARILTPGGEARFVEPAVNSKVLDALRWMVSVPGRPSSLQSKKFAAWKATDPHPQRDNSSSHYKKLGLRYFKEAEIIPIGFIERFSRLFPKNKIRRNFRRKAYHWEARFPHWIQCTFARAQTIVFKKPKR